ncbi:dihydrolipoamide acetyltransferase family protein, partial [Kitasatospora sp. NPDC005856]|uniref:dihydrolipoamide acetyltransferase family protein n=1 Tax=Kitasatospora sp. NPDC005856 TaxID=3154566 RepID=UPI0033F47643
ETAKAVVEVPCPYGGVVTARYGEEGEEIAVGAPLVTVADARSDGERPLVGYGVTDAAKGARRRRVGVSTPAPEPEPMEPAPAVVAVVSPLVRRLARENGIELTAVTGSGPDGLIMRADVERATSATVAPAAVAAAEDVVPLRGLRKAVAEKLTLSHHEIPAATCWVDADATGLMELRQQLNLAARPRISVLALLARICTVALTRYPELNASVVADGIRRHSAVHLGFAAQGERGLVVPVVRDAQLLGLERLGEELARLTESARAGSLTPAELTGGTFTLNNYGVFGVDGSTPLINHPEAAMLGVGRITPKPWVHDGQLAVRQVTQLSLTFDHRVCDGGTAGGFLRLVADLVEQPALLLRH